MKRYGYHRTSTREQHLDRGIAEITAYQCYNQVNNGSVKNREKYGLDTEGYCDIPMIGDWKLNYMIKHILEALWTDRGEAVQEVLQLIRDNYTVETIEKKNRLQISTIEARISKNEARLKQLLEMRMGNEITKEEYANARQNVEKEIEECKALLDEYTTEEDSCNEVGVNLKTIEETLNQLIDFSGPTIDNDVIDRLVMQVVPLQQDRMKWILNLAGGGNQIYAGVAGRKGKASYEGSLSFDLPTFQAPTGSY